MAYHGYMKLLSSYADKLFRSISKEKSVKILEIGVDTGISLFSIVNNLNLIEVPFEYTGVDIKIQPHTQIIQWSFMQRFNQNKINLLENNSLRYLSECNEKFDIVLIDGDHNYETVARECKELKKISHVNTLFIFDDYFGKYASTDQFYYKREGYENNKLIMIKETNGEKQGVKTAVDEFVEKEEDFKLFTYMQGEPVCMINKNNTIINIITGNE